MANKYQEKLFNENLCLAYSIAEKFYREGFYEDFQDIKQIALIGLWKASKYYDNKKAKFSTFAYKVMLNDIMLYFHRYKKQYKDLSINIPVSEDYSNNSDPNNIMTLEDKILNDFDIDEVITKLDIQEIIKKVLMKETDKRKEIYNLFLSGKSQNEIAEILGVSRQWVSYVILKIEDKIKENYLRKEVI